MPEPPPPSMDTPDWVSYAVYAVLGLALLIKLLNTHKVQGAIEWVIWKLFKRWL